MLQGVVSKLRAERLSSSRPDAVTVVGDECATYGSPALAPWMVSQAAMILVRWLVDPFPGPESLLFLYLNGKLPVNCKYSLGHGL